MLSYILVHNVATSSCIPVFCNLMLPPRGMVLFNEWFIIVFVEDCRVSATGTVGCIIRVVHNLRAAVYWTIFWAGWAIWWRVRRCLRNVVVQLVQCLLPYFVRNIGEVFQNAFLVQYNVLIVLEYCSIVLVQSQEVLC